ncbi:TetR/AcrR family transcriptional regulator [Streptomyces sp. 8K308]|uniref:TetR/AcrR family transcriptional regulator n=1 Tax=Streptomyces sp. 8K308 TaxID=2530388 RepID=UPI001A9F5423|nr:TetR/AcrR family transcriptional regulator [Streptomyces sp. 8K308]
MPRQVDYEERRRRIGEAVVALIARAGMEAVSLRDVAAEADVSMGAVQRCFRTKEEMLLFALQDISAQVTERADERIAADEAPRAAGTLLAHTLAEMALVDAESAARARVWLAFVAHAPTSERLSAVLHETYARLHELIAWLIGYGQRTGEIAGDVDADREARELVALADGLTVRAVAGHGEPEEALAMLRERVERLLVGGCGPQ